MGFVIQLLSHGNASGVRFSDCIFLPQSNLSAITHGFDSQFKRISDHDLSGAGNALRPAMFCARDASCNSHLPWCKHPVAHYTGPDCHTVRVVDGAKTRTIYGIAHGRLIAFSEDVSQVPNAKVFFGNISYDFTLLKAINPENLPDPGLTFVEAIESTRQ